MASRKGSGRSSASGDGVAVLEADHRTVERLFARFEQLGPRAHKTRRQVADRIVEELSVHAAIEEQVFYPVVRASSDDVDRHVLESLEEHHVAKWLCSEVEGMDPEHERFVPKVTVLIEMVRHHVEEEESDLFPKVRRLVDDELLAELGDALRTAKATAPTRPQPRRPDEPPASLVASGIDALVDRVRQLAAR
jgi:hemerythrin superfamily protein